MGVSATACAPDTTMNSVVTTAGIDSLPSTKVRSHTPGTRPDGDPMGSMLRIQEARAICPER